MTSSRVGADQVAYAYTQVNSSPGALSAPIPLPRLTAGSVHNKPRREVLLRARDAPAERAAAVALGLAPVECRMR